MSKNMLGAGAFLDGLLVVANQYFGWSGDLNYLLGGLAIVWGIIIFRKSN